jgi:hypothetical protein
MLRMVNAINSDNLSALVERREPRIAVICATCHRGVVEPRPLQQILLTAYDAAGADSAEHTYRNLRQRHYGRRRMISARCRLLTWARPCGDAASWLMQFDSTC